jgi:hypothetical protein
MHLKLWNEAILVKEATLEEPPLTLNLMNSGLKHVRKTGDELAAKQQQLLNNSIKQSLDVVKDVVTILRPAPESTSSSISTPVPQVPFPGFGYSHPLMSYPQQQSYATYPFCSPSFPNPQFGFQWPPTGSPYNNQITPLSSVLLLQPAATFQPSVYNPPPASHNLLPVHHNQNLSHLSSSSTAEVVPSSPVQYIGDFSTLLEEYVQWHINRAETERDRFSIIYNTLYQCGYGLEDIQYLGHKDWVELKIPVGLGRRLRGSIKLFLQEHMSAPQRTEQKTDKLQCLAQICFDIDQV